MGVGVLEVEVTSVLEDGVVMPPVGCFGTQPPFLASSPSLHDTVETGGAGGPGGVVEEGGEVRPPVGVLGEQPPLSSLVEPSPHVTGGGGGPAGVVGGPGGGGGA